MSSTFFKLTNSFAIEETKGLSASEIRILLFIKTMNPFGDRKLLLSIETIAQKLEINRSTVSRAFKKLTALGKIAIQVIRQVSITSPTPPEVETKDDPTVQDAPRQLRMQNGNPVCETAQQNAEPQQPIQNCTKQPAKSAPVSKSGQSQTYSEFVKTLSESERENFFNFVRQKTQTFDPPLISITDYLRSQSRYLELYSEFRRVTPVEESNFSIEEWKNSPDWEGILASINKAGIAFIGIGGIDRSFEHIPAAIREKLVDYVRANR